MVPSTFRFLFAFAFNLSDPQHSVCVFCEINDKNEYNKTTSYWQPYTMVILICDGAVVDRCCKACSFMLP